MSTKVVDELNQDRVVVFGLSIQDMYWLLDRLCSEMAHLRLDVYGDKSEASFAKSLELDRLNKIANNINDAIMINPITKPHCDGWLAPSGVFYPCMQSDHDKLAQVLMRKFYPNTENAGINWFEQQGWIKVYSEGFIHRYRLVKPTEYQISTLKSMLNMCEAGSEYEGYMLSALKHIEG